MEGLELGGGGGRKRVQVSRTFRRVEISVRVLPSVMGEGSWRVWSSVGVRARREVIEVRRFRAIVIRVECWVKFGVVVRWRRDLVRERRECV